MNIKRFYGSISEKFFAQLCGHHFLKGFVFHSPRNYARKNKAEVGDVVIWIRYSLIIFEVIHRIDGEGTNPKRFVKKLGDKRDQLISDYSTYGDKENEIHMWNDLEQEMIYPHKYFDENKFYGIVLIDSDPPLEKLHFNTFKKAIEQPFPIAFIRKQDFLEILTEIDTPQDLAIYLKDRKKFIDEIFNDEADYFLDLNTKYELDLIGHYKLNENTFDIQQWKDSHDKNFWQAFQKEFREKIQLRNLDNKTSQVVDHMIDFVRISNLANPQSVEHSWELATLTRRARAGIFAEKIERAVGNVSSGNRTERHFAFFNQLTECWDVFYFSFGNDQTAFEEKAKFLLKMKMYVERVQQNFQYSVFCFAFRKSSVVLTEDVFDRCFLWVEDAKDYPQITTEQYNEATKYFKGKTVEYPIKEYP
ncbi:MAG: hypothetical protein QOH51_3213 [Acidobacteriota bacterium]|jgi:hypothetical protein|nr:hypothetical protein [Acidobacteriota bacterium]